MCIKANGSNEYYLSSYPSPLEDLVKSGRGRALTRGQISQRYLTVGPEMKPSEVFLLHLAFCLAIISK